MSSYLNSKIIILCLLVVLTNYSFAKIDFAAEIWPILEERCISCHSPKAENKKRNPKGGIRLDSPTWIQRGVVEDGEKDQAIVVPGKPEESLLYTAIILPEDDDDIMPAKGEPLTKQQQQIIFDWIQSGASYEGWVASSSGASKGKQVSSSSSQTDLEKQTSSLNTGGVRRLTDVKGRTIEAEILKVTGDQVHIKLIKSGNLHTIALKKLSKKDQEFLRGFTPPKPGRSALASKTGSGPVEPLIIPEKVYGILDNYCMDCHDGESEKGDIRFDTLSGLSVAARLDLFNKMQEQIYFKEMPPKKKKTQPSDAERAALGTWLNLELRKHDASELEDKLRYYRYANYIDHEQLFNGSIKDEAYTASRRWLVNGLIYNERMNDVFRLKGRSRQKQFFGVVNPFNVSTDSGVRYYDNNSVEGGQILTLIANAEWVADRQLRKALLKSGEFKFPAAYHTTGRRQMIYKFPGEMWQLDKTEKEFERIITNKAFPSDSDLKAAINVQYEGAMQREATKAEMSRCLQYTKEAIKIGGNSEGLRKMLVTVLLESDFIYRPELGLSGKLSSRDASYAIAYALTDKIPDDALRQAANNDKLQSQDDYKREVTRILEDDSIEKPRILRFFQEYFGYDNIFNVFKDEERFLSKYNPRRIVASKYTYAVPGQVYDEANTLIQHILNNDKAVLKQLLTTNKFFVYHNGDNEDMKKKVTKEIEREDENRNIYNTLKNTNWKKDTEAVGKKAGLYLNGKGEVNAGALRNGMLKFEKKYGEGGWATKDKIPLPGGESHGNHRDSMKVYNLDYRKWSYQAVQPMKMDNRIGFLTHPAWLVAHSQNAHTDPIIRGRWIREKLLGGFIPDVPITVDAKIPDNHHETLRERFKVTEAKACWRCHEQMNPLGYVFESYDDFGRFRTQEYLEHSDNIIETIKVFENGNRGAHTPFDKHIYKTKAVNSEGYLKGTRDPKLDGKVDNVNDLMTNLAKSDYVRQIFIRNVFRYFMGRNEMLSDSKTLIEADSAYVDSGGSFNALIVSLLSSDSFIKRKNTKK